MSLVFTGNTARFALESLGRSRYDDSRKLSVFTYQGLELLHGPATDYDKTYVEFDYSTTHLNHACEITITCNSSFTKSIDFNQIVSSLLPKESGFALLTMYYFLRAHRNRTETCAQILSKYPILDDGNPAYFPRGEILEWFKTECGVDSVAPYREIIANLTADGLEKYSLEYLKGIAPTIKVVYHELASNIVNIDIAMGAGLSLSESLRHNLVSRIMCQIMTNK